MTGMESAVLAGKEKGTAKHAEHANRCLSGQAWCLIQTDHRVVSPVASPRARRLAPFTATGTNFSLIDV
jgi:hypothetical protein